MEESENQEQEFRQYHPLQELGLNPYIRLYNLPTSPEYLYTEEAAAGNRRSFNENLLYYIGSAYLAGTFAGGVKGTLEGLRSAESGEPAKIRLNRVLNSGGLGGRRLGNSLGIMALMFGGMEGVMIYNRDVDDMWNSVAAGLGTGAIYRSVAGARSAAVGAVVGGLVAGAVVRGKQVLKRFVPI